MNQQRENLKELRRQAKHIVAAMCAMVALPCQALADQNSYAYGLLTSPSPAVLSAEANGRVTIYDALHSETVDEALDSQFHRIENMMFIRTQHQNENGEYEADDDC
jgi:hypothetical protein